MLNITNKGFDWLLVDDKDDIIAYETKDSKFGVINKGQSLIEIEKAIIECEKKFIKDIHRILTIKCKIQDYNG